MQCENRSPGRSKTGIYLCSNGNQQITKFHSKMLAEEQSRLLANPTTDAKVSAAATQWRLSNPDACATLGGNKANCY